MAKCCSCNCSSCGQGQPKSSKVLKLYVCSSLDCYFQSQDIDDVYAHRDNKHGPKNDEKSHQRNHLVENDKERKGKSCGHCTTHYFKYFVAGLEDVPTESEVLVIEDPEPQTNEEDAQKEDGILFWEPTEILSKNDASAGNKGKQKSINGSFAFLLNIACP